MIPRLSVRTLEVIVEFSELLRCLGATCHIEVKVPSRRPSTEGRMIDVVIENHYITGLGFNSNARDITP
jgi:hypothetical protein